MKNFICVIIAVSVIMQLAACGGTVEPSSDNSAPVSATESTAPTPASSESVEASSDAAEFSFVDAMAKEDGQTDHVFWSVITYPSMLSSLRLDGMRESDWEDVISPALISYAYHQIADGLISIL